MSDFATWTRRWLIAWTGAAAVVLGMGLVRGETDPRERAADAGEFNRASYELALHERGLHPVSLDFVAVDRGPEMADGSRIGLGTGQVLVDFSSYRRWGTRDVEYVRDDHDVIWKVRRCEHEQWSESYEVDEQCSVGGSGAYEGFLSGGFALPPGTTYGGERTVEYDTHDVQIICLRGYIMPA